jgi:hypothetical protein
MVSEPDALLYSQWNESDLLEKVLQLARLQGWMVFHDRATNARRKCPHCGHVLHQPRNEAGWLDLVLCDPSTYSLYIVELKRETGKLTAAQGQWLNALDGMVVETKLWRPSDWGTIEAILKREE